MADLEYDRELKHKFNDATYYVRSLREDRILYVEVEQESTGYKWKNQFANTCLSTHIYYCIALCCEHSHLHSDIEEITSKTGNFKPFDKFCRMINSALESNNSSVFIDLLTYQDLEILKTRKATKSGQEPPSLNATHRTKNKRYLILTYVADFDRVHYPLALKLDETSIDSNKEQNKSRKQAKIKKKSQIKQSSTARKLLSHSIQSTNSSSTSSSSSTSIASSPQSMAKYEQKNIKNNTHNISKHKHFQSTPNLTEDKNNEQQQNENLSHEMQIVMEENMKLKMMLNREQKQSYPDDKLTEIVEVLEDEIKILKQELEKKNLEVRRVSKNAKAYESKNISKRLDDLEDEIERLSTELLSERTKCRRQSRSFHGEKMELLKKIEALEASNDHYKRKCKNLKNDLNATKETLEKVRLKASKQRLYASSSNNNSKHVSSASLRRSRSRNNSRYYLKNDGRNKSKNNKKKLQNTNKHNLSGSNLYNRHRSRSSGSRSNKSRYQRSSSAPRFGKKNSKNRSRSPVVRFDPTAWAKEKKKKIAKAMELKNTFGKSRSPSPFRTSRSVSPSNRASSKKRRKRSKNKRDLSKSRDRSNSRRRNSFGTTISNEPKRVRKKRLPLYPSSIGSGGNGVDSSVCSSTNDTSFIGSENDMNVLNTMEKRKERIFASLNERKNRSYNDIEEEEEDEEDDESSFNPTQEIESIESRMNNLQKFLRAAKSSA